VQEKNDMKGRKKKFQIFKRNEKNMQFKKAPEMEGGFRKHGVVFFCQQ